MAEDFSEDECKGLKLSEDCEGFNEEELKELLHKFGHVFSESPGLTNVRELCTQKVGMNTTI